MRVPLAGRSLDPEMTGMVIVEYRGAVGQVTTLAPRAAAGGGLDESGGVAFVLGALGGG